ncbi:hypothetical protein QBC44DRAFT_403765 [Cladorrhinum sp. PSN332]|nr:hypothetical protein QBC44DRAFT_403765 [Cladorrhinum sp. PSN332]
MSQFQQFQLTTANPYPVVQSTPTPTFLGTVPLSGVPRGTLTIVGSQQHPTAPAAAARQASAFIPTISNLEIALFCDGSATNLCAQYGNGFHDGPVTDNNVGECLGIGDAALLGVNKITQAVVCHHHSGNSEDNDEGNSTSKPGENPRRDAVLRIFSDSQEILKALAGIAYIRGNHQAFTTMALDLTKGILERLHTLAPRGWDIEIKLHYVPSHLGQNDSVAEHDEAHLFAEEATKRTTHFCVAGPSSSWV